jgi:hypothetical protein
MNEVYVLMMRNTDVPLTDKLFDSKEQAIEYATVRNYSAEKYIVLTFNRYVP